jgi:hemoglobin-like flavoprotein
MGLASHDRGWGAAANRHRVGGLPPFRRGRRETNLTRMNLNLQALEESFDAIAPRGDELMDEFYARLFETAPAVKPLFAHTDLKRQKAMLLGTLVLLRKSLRDLGSIVPKLRELGARHVAYGALPEHYPVVGEVLIASMAAVAGPAWTAEYERAWTEAFGVVAGAMIEGAERATLDEAA